MTFRVLHVIYDHPRNPWVGGGGAVRVAELYRQLGNRVNHTVVCGSFPGASDGVTDGVNYRHVGARAPYAWSRITFARAANRLLRSAAYDAAVFDFSTYSPVFVPSDRPAGITVHHLSASTAGERWGPVRAGVVRRIEHMIVRRGRRFSATSAATAAELREIVGSEPPIHLVHAGVSDSLFALDRADAGYVLYFGRMDVFQKGIDLLLHAIARLVADRPGLRVKLAGRGKDLERVRSLATELGLGRHVEVLGAVDEETRMALLRGAAVQVMPSRFEGFGMAAAEAMAAGVPLIATAAGSLPEVVGDDGGLLVPPRDPVALAEAIRNLMDDPRARDALSSRARRAAERFRWRVVAAAHLEYLRAIAADVPRGAPFTTPVR